LITPIGYADIVRAYGDPAHVVAGTVGEVAWKQAITTQIVLPSPLILPGGQKQIHLTVHKELATEILIILPEIWDVVESVECYCFRQSRTSNKLSVHCWAAALDFNKRTNPLGPRGDMPEKIKAAFAARDWEWGGHFHTPDPMHFQKARGY
jgi:hypothetical protein